MISRARWLVARRLDLKWSRNVEPFIITSIFYLAVMVLCVLRPNAGRIFIGAFFLIMAFGVHGYFILANPQGYLNFADGFALTIYRDIAVAIVEVSPVGFGVVMLLFETAVGLLILSRGRQVKFGLIAGIVFLVGIAPWGLVTMANLVLALAMAYLLTKNFERSALSAVWERFGHLRRMQLPAR
jgi:hypothetical protein